VTWIGDEWSGQAREYIQIRDSFHCTRSSTEECNGVGSAQANADSVASKREAPETSDRKGSGLYLWGYRGGNTSQASWVGIDLRVWCAGLSSPELQIAHVQARQPKRARPPTPIFIGATNRAVSTSSRRFLPQHPACTPTARSRAVA